MEWVLILSWYTDAGVPLLSVDFNSQDACEQAGAAWVEEIKSGDALFICASKGEPTVLPVPAE